MLYNCFVFAGSFGIINYDTFIPLIKSRLLSRMWYFHKNIFKQFQNVIERKKYLLKKNIYNYRISLYKAFIITYLLFRVDLIMYRPLGKLGVSVSNLISKGNIYFRVWQNMSECYTKILFFVVKSMCELNDNNGVFFRIWISYRIELTITINKKSQLLLESIPTPEMSYILAVLSPWYH